MPWCSQTWLTPLVVSPKDWSVQPVGQTEAPEVVHELLGNDGLLRPAPVCLGVAGLGRPRDVGGDVADQTVANGQHVERERKMGLLGFVPTVEGERRLTT